MDVTYYGISHDSMKVQNIDFLLNSGKYIAAYIIGIIVAYQFEHVEWIEYVLYACIGLLIIRGIRIVWSIFVTSPRYYQNCSYAFNEEFIFIKTGIWTISETIIPISKVQAVILTQDLPMRKYDVQSIIVATMNTYNQIPHIPSEEAKKIHQEISKLARIKEIEEE